LHGEDRFRMKLHSFYGEGAMTHSHDDVAPGGGDLQDVRDTFAYQRVIAADGQRRGQPLVDARAAMVNEALLAVIGPRQDAQRAAKMLDHGLMSQADTEQRCGTMEMVDVRHEIAGIGWRRGTWGKDQ